MYLYLFHVSPNADRTEHGACVSLRCLAKKSALVYPSFGEMIQHDLSKHPPELYPLHGEPTIGADGQPDEA